MFSANPAMSTSTSAGTRFSALLHVRESFSMLCCEALVSSVFLTGSVACSQETIWISFAQIFSRLVLTEEIKCWA